MKRVIYKFCNYASGEFYIGSALDFGRRKWEHLSSLKKGLHHCAPLQAAYVRDGVDAFGFEVLQEVPEGQSLLAVEDVYLMQNALDPLCYNVAHTTTSPPSYTDETRAKISAALRERFSDPTRHPRYGKTHTEETRAKISANRTGKMAGEKHYRFGKTLSTEVREKIGAAQRGKTKGPRVFTPGGLARAQENMRRVAATNPSQLKDRASVLAKFPADVLARYDFSEAVYTGALARITGVVCPAHGVFSQYAAQFRKGFGCPACGVEQRARAKSASMKRDWCDPEYRARILAARRK